MWKDLTSLLSLETFLYFASLRLLTNAPSHGLSIYASSSWANLADIPSYEVSLKICDLELSHCFGFAVHHCKWRHSIWFFGVNLVGLNLHLLAEACYLCEWETSCWLPIFSTSNSCPHTACLPQLLAYKFSPEMKGCQALCCFFWLFEARLSDQFTSRNPLCYGEWAQLIALLLYTWLPIWSMTKAEGHDQKF